ncbi:MAG: FMN-binding glutamate synthase family protein [Pseudomonadota bacterium]|uniref:FMN-binding glutamate synthase family protein n=1 Tax=Sphingobium xenophagum TaxID=121428 RepID=A0A249MZ02_SPHXE|nr:MULTISPECIES: FMN-binding glutamate synthase family protein [Sphingobium]MBU0658354.1 FMN-binding glutamate synthase family protein [Alphaproteobacteria bacterium]ASY46359.1 FMN-binding glutamate synthase family protein [Sphingobium xenophagum]MBA4754831.1 FMN-binding glutamate synthase family protein [Sphingobium sp.]MBS89584.1 FMN-binding glutamate synthase family protein [Sphingobium sp.]MBU0866571.1 FMN-binding glutamate synthase family protein [Alphaproteobacteria bacterium]|tara:strand:+ start:2178 stop:3815 length:1638 start_codon:yes stop_codon:yes gene_type:complete
MNRRPALADSLFRDHALSRNALLLAGLVGTIAVTLIGLRHPRAFWLLLLFVPLLVVALIDLLQTHHSLRRNYPVSARFRWFFEWLRPFLRSYIVESDLDGRPFSHDERALVYARAKGDVSTHPFGTELDVYSEEYEWLAHSIAPSRHAEKYTRVSVGTDQCSRPYSAARLNISAMSFGALGSNAIEALNLGARIGGFYHDTGEGGLSPYHLKHGGDIVWELGSGYFGCRNASGNFDPAHFRDKATNDAVVMTEIKLSQGAKPGHGGLLPGPKVTAEIARIRDIPEGEDCLSPPFHTAFSTPRELLAFAAQMRDLSGGKPVGIKLCVGYPHELFAVVKAMIETEILVDFIVIDGAEGGTGAAPTELSDRVGMPLREGLILARNALVGTNLKDKVRLAASGKVNSGAAIAMNAALGADWCNAARSFMFSLGCVQSMRCHTDTCPTGVATQSPARQRALVVPEKAERVARFQRATLDALHDIVVAAGLNSPDEFTPDGLRQRINAAEMRSIDEIYPFVQPGELLDGARDPRLANWWNAADPASFARRA